MAGRKRRREEEEAETGGDPPRKSKRRSRRQRRSSGVGGDDWRREAASEAACRPLERSIRTRSPVSGGHGQQMQMQHQRQRPLAELPPSPPVSVHARSHTTSTSTSRRRSGTGIGSNLDGINERGAAAPFGCCSARSRSRAHGTDRRRPSPPTESTASSSSSSSEESNPDMPREVPPMHEVHVKFEQDHSGVGCGRGTYRIHRTHWVWGLRSLCGVSAAVFSILAVLTSVPVSVLYATTFRHIHDVLRLQAGQMREEEEAASRYADLERRHHATSQSLREALRDKVGLEKSVEGVNVDLGRAQSRIVDLERNVALTRKELSDTTKFRDDAVRSLEETTTEKVELQRLNDGVRADLSLSESLVSHLESTLTRTEDDLTDALDRLWALRGTNDDFVSALDGAWGRIDELTDERNDLTVELTRARRRIQQLEEMRGILSSDLERFMVRAEDLAEERRAVDTELEAARSAIGTLTTDGVHLRDQLADARRNLDELRAQLLKSHREIDAFHLQVSKLETDDEASSRTITELDTMNYRLLRDVESLQRRMDDQLHGAVSAVDAVASAAARRRAEEMRAVTAEWDGRVRSILAEAARAVNAVVGAANGKRLDDLAGKDRQMEAQAEGAARAVNAVVDAAAAS